eukprot:5093198-Amphidinium_carterae.1
MSDSLSDLLQSELAEPADDLDHGQKKKFLTKALACWRQHRMHSSISVRDASCIAEEVDLLATHWRPLFEH